LLPRLLPVLLSARSADNFQSGSSPKFPFGEELFKIKKEIPRS